MKKWLLVVVLTFSAVTGGEVSQEPVAIPDAALKKAIERTLGTSDPNPAEMLHLTSLRAEGVGIVDLTGLAYARNLFYLCLKDNEIQDLSPLYGLRVGIVLLEGNRDFYITPPPLHVRNEDNYPVALPETVRDKIYELIPDFFYQHDSLPL